MELNTTRQTTVLTAAEVGALPLVPLGTLKGVTHRQLWHDGISMAGVLTVEAGHHLGAHAHRAHHHHLWVVEGVATVLGSELGPGSYVHVPAGVRHDIDTSGTEGCTVFYLYMRDPA